MNLVTVRWHRCSTVVPSAPLLVSVQSFSAEMIKQWRHSCAQKTTNRDPANTDATQFSSVPAASPSGSWAGPLGVKHLAKEYLTAGNKEDKSWSSDIRAARLVPNATWNKCYFAFSYAINHLSFSWFSVCWLINYSALSHPDLCITSDVIEFYRQYCSVMYYSAVLLHVKPIKIQAIRLFSINNR